MNTEYIVHPFPPLYDEQSTTLILGSFPSIKSREAMFFYGHPQNRFWRVLASLFEQNLPMTITEKKEMVLRHHLALWDSIHSCTVTGSSDNSIKDVVPNDISQIIRESKVNRIFCNGTLSHKMYMKYIFLSTGIEAIKLPSTSPANAAYSLEKLLAAWRSILPVES